VLYYFLRDEGNVRRMDTAIKMNKLVQEKSMGSKLIMINLPKPPTSDEKEFICIFSLLPSFFLRISTTELVVN